ncbi:hypothetical protein HMPREF9564_02078 [Cutibacterium acnes HL053PA1]|nr:hypothetical protein HMPREF9604_01960 [Cutibacterium acnes HL036PA1]EFS62929.1 hypothetical protein HMPREF9611_01947 [Cutibacterium acnes HL063PA1]EFS65217.1 hypothetical protein HMPREF9612_02231 [Cutibacterium acnes HL063PA2]EFT17468.1 hypothetical protein HMPREF9564_02078 [Cutibacterium acnes HL053PA1]EFT20146.1 hypothetical protein HMPREF9566_02073 [Cutibacterium acnes HL045PA1]EFT32204.1 hypothetical protein HMPREF9595_00581 [Cutibacterium acnes HL005PA2]EFT56276.1 hypothetical protein
MTLYFDDDPVDAEQMGSDSSSSQSGRVCWVKGFGIASIA